MSKVDTIISELQAIASNPKKAMDDYKAETGKGAVGMVPVYTPDEIVYAAGRFRTIPHKVLRARCPCSFCATSSVRLRTIPRTVRRAYRPCSARDAASGRYRTMFHSGRRAYRS